MSARLIILNGVSSSGKSTLAQAIRSLSSEPYVVISMDDFLDMGDKSHPFGLVGPPLLSAMMLSAGAFLASGCNLIMDCVFDDFTEKPKPIAYLERLRISLRLFQVEEIHPLIVRVTASQSILAAREADRSERQAGLAAYQASRIHVGIPYDIILDSSTGTPAELASRILNYAFLRAE